MKRTSKKDTNDGIVRFVRTVMCSYANCVQSDSGAKGKSV